MILMKTNLPGFEKDSKTGILVNTNVNSIRQAKEARRQWKQQRNNEDRIHDLERRIAALEAKLK